MAARQDPCHRRKSRRQPCETRTSGLRIREQKVHCKQTKFSVSANPGRQKSSGGVRTISQEIARGQYQLSLEITAWRARDPKHPNLVVHFFKYIFVFSNILSYRERRLTT